MANSKYEVVSLTMEELLSPETAAFEVPDFQRAYSWEAEQINQLIDDVFVSSAGDELPYFLGSIVLASSENSNDSNRSRILDGQQRLTTLSLLIAALRQQLEEYGAIKEAVRYEMRLFSYENEESPNPKILLQRGEDSTTYETLIKEPLKHHEKRYKNTRIQPYS